VLALLRIPLEAAALMMVKNGLADEARLSLFFTGGVIVRPAFSSCHRSRSPD